MCQYDVFASLFFFPLTEKPNIFASFLETLQLLFYILQLVYSCLEKFTHVLSPSYNMGLLC